MAFHVVNITARLACKPVVLKGVSLNSGLSKNINKSILAVRTPGNFCPRVILKYTKIANFARSYFPTLQHFPTKLCNFTKLKMLFQAEAMKFPISSFSNFIYKVKGPLSGRRPSLGGHANCQVTLFQGYCLLQGRIQH
jgi:hypothetical protein